MSVKRAKPPGKPSKPLEQALRALVAGLKASARPSMIIGGIAVIARGVARLTRDIDATVAGDGTDLEALLAVLQRHGVVPRIQDAVRFAQQSHVLLLRHAPSGIDVDLSLGLAHGRTDISHQVDGERRWSLRCRISAARLPRTRHSS